MTLNSRDAVPPTMSEAKPGTVLQDALVMWKAVQEAHRHLLPIGRCPWDEVQAQRYGAGYHVDQDDDEDERVASDEEEEDNDFAYQNAVGDKAIARLWGCNARRAWQKLPKHAPWHTGYLKRSALGTQITLLPRVWAQGGEGGGGGGGGGEGGGEGACPKAATIVELENFDLEFFETLYDHGEHSPFGDVATQTTRVDPAVRRGRELLAGVHWTVPDELCDMLARTWDENDMTPSGVKVVPYKMSLYREGDGFAVHSDTPAHNLVGTILVGLFEDAGTLESLESEGDEGGFFIRHNDDQFTRWSCKRIWDKRIWEYGPPPVIMFYADCPHRVEAKGRRATLSFKVFSCSPTASPTPSPKPGSNVSSAPISELGCELGFEHEPSSTSSSDRRSSPEPSSSEPSFKRSPASMPRANGSFNDCSSNDCSSNDGPSNDGPSNDGPSHDDGSGPSHGSASSGASDGKGAAEGKSGKDADESEADGEDEDEDEDEDEEEDTDEVLRAKFVRGCQRLLSGPCRSGFGLVLSHGYNLHAEEFKGEDATAWLLLQGVVGVKLVLPVLIRMKAEYYDQEPGANEAETAVYPMRDEDVRHVAHKMGAPAAPAPSAVIVDEAGNMAASIPFFFLSRTSLALRADHTPFVEYTGNQCEPGSVESIYLQRAVVVQPHSQSSRQLPQGLK